MQPSEHDTPAKQIDLESLYPTPKSFDDLAQIQKERETMFESRKPRHIILSTTVRLYPPAIGLIALIRIVPSLVESNVIGGVFFSFFLALVLLASTLYSTRLISDDLSKLDIDAQSLLATYIIAYGIAVSLAHTFVISLNLVTLAICAAVLHSIFVYGLMRFILHTTASAPH